jgi:alpha-glucosidase
MGSLSVKEKLRIAGSLGTRALLARLLYTLRQGWKWQFLTSGATGRGQRGARETLTELISFQLAQQTIELHCHNGALCLDILAHDLIRFRLLPSVQAETGTANLSPPFSYALDSQAEWPPVPFDVEECDEGLIIRTKRLTCRVERSPCRLNFLDAQGNPLSEPAAGLGFRNRGVEGAGVFCTRRLVQEEAIYGLGEKSFDLNLRGRKLEMWNTDPAVYAPGDDPINLNIPMLVGLRQGRAYGFFFDNPGRARFDLGHTRSDLLRYEADAGGLCVYFFSGPSMPAVLERYTQLTGRMPLPPRWMLGYHQSRWSYESEQEVRHLAAELRRRRIPCDVIHLDIHYLDGYRIFTWHPRRFPDPPRLLADLRQDGFRTINILDPGVKVDPGYHVHDEGIERDAFCKSPDGTLFTGPVWPGDCYFPDFTDPRVRAWWGSLYHPLLEAGVSGFWNDMNEPAVFGGEMPANVVHSYEGQGASHQEVHNIYGLQMARASAEGLGQLRPNERLPLISRSGYAGLQRYALVWTADNQSTWAQLRLAVSMCLNLGLSGIAFCGPDVGGFAGDCNGELLARWTQVGALMPFFRNHSAMGTARQEPWAFGEPYESICRRWIEFRYELLPYLYTVAWQATLTGMPMARPLALAFPEDASTYGINDQFLLGDAIMAAPVGHSGQVTRKVALPGDWWYDFWTGKPHGGQITADAPLERMPLYVRAGSVVPLAPVMQHTGEWPPDTLRLLVYPGSGESWLYEDDGHTRAFQSGEFQVTRFECKEDGGCLTVHREVEGPFDPGYRRFQITIHGLDAAPCRVLVDGQEARVAFDEEAGTARLAVGEWARMELLL